jgi:SAM-dependent methyltransferase
MTSVNSQGPAPGGPDRETPAQPAGPPSFDTSLAHPARVYDYLLGGKDNYQADRETAEQAIAAAPECRIVYVDNDPIVLSHARALLTSTPEGATAYIEADARDTGTILEQAARTLDFSQPVAVMMLLVLQYVPDSDDPDDVVARVIGAMAPGSYLTISDTTRDIDAGRTTGAVSRLNAGMGPTHLTLRTRDEIARRFAGLDLVDPGIVPVPQWRASNSLQDAEPVPVYGCMGRKPS